MINVGLDFDGTHNARPEIFNEMIQMFQRNGDKVYLVTMRYPTEWKDIDYLINMVDGVLFTERKAKKPFCEALGIKIDIWIDDNPRAVNEDGLAIWNMVNPEGLVTKADPDTGELTNIKAVAAPYYLVPPPEGHSKDITPPYGLWVHFQREMGGLWELGYVRSHYNPRSRQSETVISVVDPQKKLIGSESLLTIDRTYYWRGLTDPYLPMNFENIQ